MTGDVARCKSPVLSPHPVLDQDWKIWVESSEKLQLHSAAAAATSSHAKSLVVLWLVWVTELSSLRFLFQTPGTQILQNTVNPGLS